MIPACMGSQRLKQKNLRELGGVPLITRMIRKCLAAGVFDQIWVNSEHPTFGEIATQEGVNFHQRPPELANNRATSEQFVYEFLKTHTCDYLFQVHTIAPLLTTQEVADVVQTMLNSDYFPVVDWPWLGRAYMPTKGASIPHDRVAVAAGVQVLKSLENKR
jgi:CMP-N-acetylneuraminic acid synthetase